MSLFGRSNPEDQARQLRQKLSREQMERGGLPLDAERRLRELHGRQNRFFTSNLSVSEFVLAADEGIRPLGQVMGSTVYHVGWQYTPVYASTELAALTHAQYHARMLALSRLQQEARLLGAHGVIGVRLTRRMQEWGENLLEFSARGTAIALDKGDVPQNPFVCALSGQEFWTLRRSGYLPCGFAFGTCVYYNVASYGTQWVTQGSGAWGAGRANMELTDYTQAVYTARHLAMSRLEDDARRVNGDGIVGVTIEDDIRTYEVEQQNMPARRDLVVQFTALGTVVTAHRDRWPVVDYALPLNG